VAVSNAAIQSQASDFVIFVIASGYRFILFGGLEFALQN